MVKRICLLVLLVSLRGLCHAQSTSDYSYLKNEIDVGIGGPTSIRYGNETWFDCAAASASIRLFHYLKRNLAVGGSVGYAWGRRGVGEDWYDYWEGNVHHEVQVTLDYRYYNSIYLMGGAKWAYVNNKCFGMYMRGEVGLQRQHFWYDGPYNLGGTPDLSKVKAAVQLSPIGIEGGIKNLHLFLEIGYGMEGIFNAGLSYRFGK